MATLDFSSLDIPAEVERHTSTRLHPSSRSGKQFSGACPYDDCSVDDNGFTVWPELTDRGRHYYCRGCRRSGDIVKLLMDIKGLRFPDACAALGLELPAMKGKGKTAARPAPAKGGGARPPAQPSKDCVILRGLYPRAQLALQRPRARAYLAQRGIPFDLAQLLGLGYIPSFDTLDRITPDLRTIQQWSDRIIFPLRLPDTQELGFTGRALALWHEGMSEQEHKKLLDEAGIPRYMTTYPTGYFHLEALEGEHVTFVEGPFDACALIAGGIPDALATCGTSLDALAIPLSLRGATLAYDGDEAGRVAVAALRKLFRRELGINPTICTPPVEDAMGKDWSERYRLHGQAGLAPLLELERNRYAYTAYLARLEAEIAAADPAPDLLCACGAVADDFTPEGEPVCSVCMNTYGLPQEQEQEGEGMTREQFTAIVEQITAGIPVKEMKLFRRGEYTLDMHVAMLAQREREQARQMQRAAARHSHK